MTERELQEQIDLELRKVYALNGDVAQLETRLCALQEKILAYIHNTGDANCMEWLETKEIDHNQMATSTNRLQQDLERTEIIPVSDFNARLRRLEHRLKVAKCLREQLELHKTYLEGTITKMQIKVTGTSLD